MRFRDLKTLDIFVTKIFFDKILAECSGDRDKAIRISQKTSLAKTIPNIFNNAIMNDTAEKVMINDDEPVEKL